MASQANDIKDQPVEVSVDPKVITSDDWTPLEILTQDDAVRWAKKYSGPEKIAFITQDRNLFSIENIDFGRNHAIDNNLKGFNV